MIKEVEISRVIKEVGRDRYLTKGQQLDQQQCEHRTTAAIEGLVDGRLYTGL